VVVIAHRLSTVMRADQVIVLQDGRLVERGRPADLLKSNGRFVELYGLQRADGLVG
jgi:ABC-type multidrug transport system fused ATPase/permease subunit